jgi:hypothetical protein
MQRTADRSILVLSVRAGSAPKQTEPLDDQLPKRLLTIAKEILNCDHLATLREIRQRSAPEAWT